MNPAASTRTVCEPALRLHRRPWSGYIFMRRLRGHLSSLFCFCRDQATVVVWNRVYNGGRLILDSCDMKPL